MPFHQLVIDLGSADPGAADHPVLEPPPDETPLWPEVRLRALFPVATDPRMVAATLMAVLTRSAGAICTETVADRSWERELLKDSRPMRFGQRLWVCPGG